nr:MAG TPA: hypothetical protein [Caudoviricetes sp.]DAZ82526.1 MAG TPA: hypothetical protein [Caudoviricetes sp.]
MAISLNRYRHDTANGTDSSATMVRLDRCYQFRISNKISVLIFKS